MVWRRRLNQGGGIQVSGVTDLALTASDKPEETVYLRGFIGGSYDGTTWQALMPMPLTALP